MTLTDEQKSKIFELKSQGKSAVAISKELGIGRSTIYSTLKEVTAVKVVKEDSVPQEQTPVEEEEVVHVPFDPVKFKLISKINHLDPPENKEEQIKKMSKMSEIELQTILQQVEHSRGVNMIANQLKYMVYMGTTGIEQFTQKVFKLKTNGYSDLIRAQDEQLTLILRDMALDSSFEKMAGYQTPTIRLGTFLITSLLLLDSKNRQAIPPEENPKFKDL
jgi:hypothetical protein